MIVIILNTIAAILVIVTSAVILFKKNIRFPFKILAYWMIVSVIFLPVPILLELNQFVNFPHFYRVPSPFVYLIGPIIYIFTRAALNDEKKFYKTDWLHAIPFLLHFIELVPFYLSPASVKQNILHQIDWNRIHNVLNNNEGILTEKTHLNLKFLSSIIYVGFSINIIYNYVKISNSIKNKIILFVFLMVLCRCIQMLLVIIDKVTDISFFPNRVINLVNVISLIFMVLILLFQTISFSGISDQKFYNKFISLSELELLDRRMKLQAMDHSSDDIILFLSPNYELLHFNKAAEDYFYLMTKKNLRYQNIIKKSSTDPIFKWVQSNIDLVLKDYKPHFFEVEQVLKKDGVKEWFSINLTPIFNEEATLIGVTLLAKNISYKKEIELKYYQQIKSLEEIAFRHSLLMRAPLVNII
jgi:PAS domain S-box-containing protein